MRCEDCVHEKVCEGFSNCETEGLCEPKRPHGEWIESKSGLPTNHHYCSNCNEAIRKLDYQNFCPNCGADMRKEGEGK